LYECIRSDVLQQLLQPLVLLHYEFVEEDILTYVANILIPGRIDTSLALGL